MKNFKKIAAFLHLWLGLISGVIITIVAITGCIFVFEDELFNFFHQDIVYVKAAAKPLPLYVLEENAQKALPKGEKINLLQVKSDSDAYLFSANKANKKSKSIFFLDQVAYNKDVYINQFTGKVKGVINRKYEFFRLVRMTHQFLLLKKEIGSLIVGSSVLMFLFIILTGFVIWLPKKLKNLKQRLVVKWNAKFKRLNWDLHSVFGFYVIPFALILVITGLVWSFRWWELGIYKSLGTAKRPNLLKEYVSLPGEVSTKTASNIALNTIKKLNNGNFKIILLNYPEDEKMSMMATVQIVKTGDAWRGLSYFYFNPNTGTLFDKILHQDKSLGMKWRNSNLDIHDGGIFGWPTQVLAFLASLIIATLPTTGFLIWLGKKKKKKINYSGVVSN
ncbi:PepSY-associated TM helix domain-containing protein [Pedobacter sp. CFBP9032]|uniref:PepSY-associated TM helix domain-containing protein n=1 Tax=Pedobacter sp. CFBP9032 TaxID=3096539 RepID=UPI002A6A8EBF|nr:PepSY-associated TM helix domain-containing protein [Pedobacter sp. CFBP9032]MDY0906759.1 PepSY-associated TM helix domain-containing protein [Pedobacter sp. CFBP9032]